MTTQLLQAIASESIVNTYRIIRIYIVVRWRCITDKIQYKILKCAIFIIDYTQICLIYICQGPNARTCCVIYPDESSTAR